MNEKTCIAPNYVRRRISSPSSSRRHCDAENQNEALAFASLQVKELNMMVNTDLEGNFDLELAPGTYTLVYDFVGYDPIEQKTVLTNESLVLNPVVLKAYQMQSPPSLAMNE